MKFFNTTNYLLFSFIVFALCSRTNLFNQVQSKKITVFHKCYLTEDHFRTVTHGVLKKTTTEFEDRLELVVYSKKKLNDPHTLRPKTIGDNLTNSQTYHCSDGLQKYDSFVHMCELNHSIINDHELFETTLLITNRHHCAHVLCCLNLRKTTLFVVEMDGLIHVRHRLPHFFLCSTLSSSCLLFINLLSSFPSFLPINSNYPSLLYSPMGISQISQQKWSHRLSPTIRLFDFYSEFRILSYVLICFFAISNQATVDSRTSHSSYNFAFDPALHDVTDTALHSFCL